MKLDDTKRLLDRNLEESDPMDLLVNVLEAAVELISIEGNDFIWSSWSNADEALAEVRSLLARVQSGVLPERADVAILFAPTGPIQEVSLSSGWAEAFLKVAERYDYAEQKLWG
ncbi:MAG: hypothetical protein R3F27_07215 [Gammaproteobacteria bacterium]